MARSCSGGRGGSRVACTGMHNIAIHHGSGRRAHGRLQVMPDSCMTGYKQREVCDLLERRTHVQYCLCPVTQRIMGEICSIAARVTHRCGHLHGARHTRSSHCDCHGRDSCCGGPSPSPEGGARGRRKQPRQLQQRRSCLQRQAECVLVEKETQGTESMTDALPRFGALLENTLCWITWPPAQCISGDCTSHTQKAHS